MTRLAPILLALTACGHPLPERPAASAELAAKHARYVELSAGQPWHEDDCDGLLFRSLLEAGYGRSYAVERWRDDDGAWYRRPRPTHRACDPTSRDMYLGLMWYVWAQERVDIAEQVFDYGLDHFFIMDARDPKISYLLEDHQFTWALMTQRLGGKDYGVWRLPTPCVGFLGGFEAHLQALVIGLRALMDAGDDANERCITQMVDAHPTNAFFQAIKGLYTGDQSETERLLLTEKWWPADRLPTSADRCSPWLNERDENHNWLPCPEEGKTHSGGDFAISAAIVLGLL